MEAARPRVRLTPDGAAFLTNYARTVNSYPHKPEKEAILASLRAIPGNEQVTLQKLASWFARHRNPVLLDDETILFPLLTPTHLQQLRVLHKKLPDPPEGVVTFWAARIKAERAEVAAWIQYQQEKAKESVRATPDSPDIPSRQLVRQCTSVSPTLLEFPRPHLPTPAESLSPSTSPHTRMPSLPPIAVKVESVSSPSFKNHVRSTEPRLSLSRLPTTETPSASVPRAFLPVEQNAALAASIRDSLATPSEQPPRTPDEFAEKFERVEHMIESFMNMYDSGRLVRLGWGPTAP